MFEGPFSDVAAHLLVIVITFCPSVTLQKDNSKAIEAICP